MGDIAAVRLISRYGPAGIGNREVKVKSEGRFRSVFPSSSFPASRTGIAKQDEPSAKKKNARRALIPIFRYLISLTSLYTKMYVKNLSQHLKNHKQQQIADDRQPSLAKVASKLHNRARPPLTNNNNHFRCRRPAISAANAKQVRFQVASIDLNCRLPGLTTPYLHLKQTQHVLCSN